MTVGRLAGSLTVLAVLFLGGCASAPDAGVAAAPTPGATATASSAPSVPKPSSTPRGPRPLPVQKAASVTSVAIPSIGVKATSLERLSLLDNGSLAAPKNPDRAGWFAGGTVPGEVGPAVIAGHVDSTTGPAVFFDLAQLRPGAKITVGRSDGASVRFRVDRVITTAKKGFPTDEVFGPTPDAELRLITCGGPYQKSVGYLDNTVVFATEVS